MPMSLGDFVETVMTELGPFLEEGTPVSFHLKVGVECITEVGWVPVVCSLNSDFDRNDISFVVKANTAPSQDVDGGHYPETATGINLS